MVIAIKLASKGYYQGDVGRVLDTRVDHIMAILDYEKFIPDYQDAYIEINKEN